MQSGIPFGGGSSAFWNSFSYDDSDDEDFFIAMDEEDEDSEDEDLEDVVGSFAWEQKRFREFAKSQQSAKETSKKSFSPGGWSSSPWHGRTRATSTMEEELAALIEEEEQIRKHHSQPNQVPKSPHKNKKRNRRRGRAKKSAKKEEEVPEECRTAAGKQASQKQSAASAQKGASMPQGGSEGAQTPQGGQGSRRSPKEGREPPRAVPIETTVPVPEGGRNARVTSPSQGGKASASSPQTEKVPVSGSSSEPLSPIDPSHFSSTQVLGACAKLLDPKVLDVALNALGTVLDGDLLMDSAFVLERLTVERMHAWKRKTNLDFVELFSLVGLLNSF